MGTDRQLKYDIILALKDRTSSAAGAIEQSLERVRRKTEEISKGYGAIGDRLSVVSTAFANGTRVMASSVEDLKTNFNAVVHGASQAAPAMDKLAGTAPRFNTLNMSVQQVARELPSLAISANTFFLAISNNLPILADDIRRVREENALLTAAGGKAVPVWKQLASSLFSWQTALVAGVTVLTLYGDDIVKFIGNLLGLKDAVDAEAEVEKALADVRKESIKDSAKEATRLEILYAAAQDENRSKRERLAIADALRKQYPSYLEQFRSEEIIAGRAADAYKNLADSLVKVELAKKSVDKVAENKLKLDDLEKQLEDVENKSKNAGMGLGSTEKSLVSAFLRSLGPLGILPDLAFQAADPAIKAYYERQAEGLKEQIAAIKKTNDELLKNIDPASLLGGGTGKDGGKGDLNTDLGTIGGIEEKIRSLREEQAKADEAGSIALERQIIQWQEILELKKKAIARGVSGNVAEGRYGKLSAPEMPTLEVAPVRLPITIDQKQVDDVNRRYRESLGLFVEEASVAGERISAMLGGSIASFGEALGEALTDGNWSEALRGILMSVMDMLSQFGKALIAAGAAKIAFDNLFFSGPGAIIAGTALVVATAAAKAALKNATAFADGGIVSGPTLALVGEYAGASNNPEVIAPLDKLKSIIGAGTDRPVFGEVVFKIKGDALEGVLSKFQHKKNRTR